MAGRSYFRSTTSQTNQNTGEQAKPELLTGDELKRQEREAIINALKWTNGKVSGPGGAAELLGIKPTTLVSRITAMRINRRAFN